jgi:hypothetical protein
MNDDSSLARNSAAAASSGARPHRLIGWAFIVAPGGGTGFSVDAPESPVHVMPGQMALTRTPRVA